MADDRNIAGKVLQTATNVVMTQRGTQHGDAENSFGMIAAFWNAYLMHVAFRRTGQVIDPGIKPQDVAEMMSLLKKARKVYGQNDPDHYVDDAGYIGLAAMLAKVEIAAPVYAANFDAGSNPDAEDRRVPRT